jgi:holo-[acyl-carrier protein] synthase
MNILGIGLDATEIHRVAEVFARYGERFLRRVFTDGEIAYCTRRRNPVPHIEVVRAGGPPRLQFHGGAERRAASMSVRRSLLTITHSDTLALAQVMLIGE